MNENPKWKIVLHNVLSFFTNKKTIKGARLTYEVTWNVVLLFIILICIGSAFAIGIGAGYFASLVKDEPIRSYDSMKKAIYNYEETSELYFASNEYLGKLPTDLEREEVKIQDVSPYLKNAVIATEDENFYKHDGVVPKAIFRALVQEVTNSSTQSGGSTLTQQLIKNQILTNEVSFERKAKEILLALRLEKFFEKEEILEAYLNVSTFGRNSSGRNIAGVQSAANGIFGVNVKDLSLPQAAFIAGLPQSPFGYTPFTQEGKLKQNLDPGLNRMRTVLNRMYDQEKISKKEYEQALNYDITQDFIGPKSSPIENYPWVTIEIAQRATDIIAEILAKEDGYTKEDLDNDEILYDQYTTLADRLIHQNGYKIHSTINKEIYDIQQETVANYGNFGPDKAQKTTDPETGEQITVMEPVETGAVLIENKTGAILSFVGGRDYNREATNHALSSVRPNGSTMKPILVYAPAIELGTLSPGSVLPDIPLNLNPSTPGKVWPNNYDFKFHGLVTARYALEKSYNVPAVKAYIDIMPNNPIQYLEKMGITSLDETDGSIRAAAIGGIKNGVSVEENTNAYTTFANGGDFIDAYLIEKIEDKDGNIVYQHEINKVSVFSPQTAYLTLDMMRDVVNSGTAANIKARLQFQSDWAGKTGTTQDFEDSWLVATNPNITFGVWTGYDTPKSLTSNYSTRNNFLWADLMNAAYKVAPELIDPAESFKMPGGIVSRSVCSVSGMLPSEGCSKAGLVTTDLFKSDSVPSQVDDSLVVGKYVQIGNQKYMALESTPNEFANEGLMLNPDYLSKLFGIKIKDASALSKNNAKLANLILPSNKMEDNGKNPDPITTSLNGSVISWGNSGESDVIGYHIYRNGQLVSSLKADSNLSYSASNGAYYITTIDIAGKESAPSNVLVVGENQQIDNQANENTTETTEQGNTEQE
ncbi:transglycosylase domain-containing protein [Bacillus sp. B1-b2]|uniref:transglycosylase domain-containing protein n=1 Tax=Bacillus sp. B1-b2 TaxID=2653201 RepID=UPI001261BA59|nr:transglycosylase domain-containing protein [Bacillus sp. B1-b2]KAB7666771.1 penicillin-binding protein [Bacillus sp. B1-b2]